MSISPYRFTIFTATKNRGNLLRRVYEQVENQTYNGSYEWVVVSDGSSDSTAEVMADILKKAKIPVTFINNEEGGGKHVAWRLGTKAFKGRYVVSCDDDDLIKPDMLEMFDRHWAELEKSPYYDLFWEVRNRDEYENGEIIGEPLPEPYFDSDYNEVTFKLHKGCDMSGCRKVEVLRGDAAVPDHFYFEDKCSNYPEGLRWSKAARKYKTRFFPEVSRTYIIGHESLMTTPNGSKRSMAKNYNSLVSNLYGLNERRDLFLKYSPKDYFLSILMLAYFSIKCKEHVLKLVKYPVDRTLVLLAYPLAFAKYLKRRRL